MKTGLKGKAAGQLEQWYPVVLGFISIIIYFVGFSDYEFTKSLREIFVAFANLNGICIGFLITAKSIIFTINDNYIIRLLKKHHSYNRLIDYFMSGIQLAFISIFISTICLFFNFEINQEFLKYIFATWLFFIVASGSACYRIINLFSEILKIPS
jgi:hypothetical protein